MTLKFDSLPSSPELTLDSVQAYLYNLLYIHTLTINYMQIPSPPAAKGLSSPRAKNKTNEGDKQTRYNEPEITAIRATV